MLNDHESAQTLTNGKGDVNSALVRELQSECARLREALAKVQAERDAYVKVIYANARILEREFENLDIQTLEAMSAGPVEIIE